METKKCVLFIVVLSTCLLAFGLPYIILRPSNQVYHDPALRVVTQEPSASATSSTQKALTIYAFATLFSTPAGSPTSSLTAVPLPSHTPSPTITSTHTPSASPTNTYPPPTFTDRPDPKPTRSIPTNTPSGYPTPTTQPPTNPPPDASPPDPPVDPSPTDPPIVPPIIATLIPIFP